MNLLAFLMLIGAAWSVVFFFVFTDQVEDVLRAIADRIRNPQPSHYGRTLQELHRHWELMDGVRKEGE